MLKFSVEHLSDSSCAEMFEGQINLDCVCGSPSGYKAAQREVTSGKRRDSMDMHASIEMPFHIPDH